ncbi:MAG TPA: hypothetical protein PKC35_08045, partial [Leptospiraceae bacterium]|nr:hypothetical protein [Leptospiraceae bacterium]
EIAGGDVSTSGRETPLASTSIQVQPSTYGGVVFLRFFSEINNLLELHILVICNRWMKFRQALI